MNSLLSYPILSKRSTQRLSDILGLSLVPEYGLFQKVCEVIDNLTLVGCWLPNNSILPNLIECLNVLDLAHEGP